MKCYYCSSDLNENDAYCSKCGSIQLTIKNLNDRAKKIMLSSIIIGMVCIVISFIGFFLLMDHYSNNFFDFHDNINSKEDAWHFILFINYPFFMLTSFAVIGINIIVVGYLINSLYSRKEI